ncbi:MAG: hypothetical protein QM790_19865 [Nibricoccus sp.]
MSAPTNTVLADSQMGIWAEGLARRLSYLQTSLAEETVEAREARLGEEISRALQPISGNKRRAYLDALAERFPTWQMATVSFDSAGSAPTPQTPDELVTALCAVAPQLTPERRASIAERLAKVCVVKETGRVVDGVALTEIQKCLKLSPSENIDPQRLGRLFALLADMAAILDQLTWSVWRTIAPRSALRRDHMVPELRVLMKRSLAGESETSSTQVYQQIEKTRQLLSALLASLDAVGRGFAQSFQMHYSPEAIREVVRAEGKPGLFDNPDARAWQRYTERTAPLTVSSIETDIREHLVRLTEELARGENR